MMNHRSTTNACARILIAALALFACLWALMLPARAEADGMLRVKLARLGSPSAIEMRADCDYYLAADPTVRVLAGTEMTIAASDGALTLTAGDGAVDLGPSAQLMRSVPGNAGVQFLSPALSNRFCGDLSFAATGDVITTVLRIYVEDYLYGAVGYELAPTSGLEALKAQAIVARNYALRQKAARSGASYDLSDSGDALSYRGYSAAADYADVLRAVDATQGQTLYYGDAPATCYYCDSNGGQIESSANALGEALPYSAVRDDPYDYDGGGAKKTAELRKDAADLAPELTAALIDGAARQAALLGLSADPAD
ncbi:MAG: SpoIID/LytB domain-containing protein, partial [Clostridia bacterium]|nr:SpoIID/LytB domain-containing protein [Clostridia bacterium]